MLAKALKVAKILATAGQLERALANVEHASSYFRIITESSPEANLLSNAAKGLRPRELEKANELIYNGISMFDTIKGAISRMPVLERGGKTVYGIGRFLLKSDDAITVTKTLGPGHYTINGEVRDLMSRWVDSIIEW